MKNRFRNRFLLALLLTAGLKVWTCQVPVFRYALERWNNDPFTIRIFEKGKTPAAAATYEHVITASDALLQIEHVDVTENAGALAWQYEDLNLQGDFPWVQVVSPEHQGEERIVWQGRPSVEWATQLVDSPLRQAISAGLLSGSSVVWLFIPGPNEEENQQLQSNIEGWLKAFESEIPIPEGVYHLHDLPDLQGQTVDMDNVLRSNVPLQIKFQVLVARSGQPEEALFEQMIRTFQPLAKSGQQHQPFLIPFYGRGRMLPGLPASAISRERIREACNYLCGICSCTVKNQSPGVDLIWNMDWGARLGASAPPLFATSIQEKAPEEVWISGQRISPWFSGPKALSILLVAIGGFLYAGVMKRRKP